MTDRNSTEVWLHLKGREKALLVALRPAAVRLLTQPDTIIQGERENKEGAKSVVGFNTNDIITFEYKSDINEVVESDIEK